MHVQKLYNLFTGKMNYSINENRKPFNENAMIKIFEDIFDLLLLTGKANWNEEAGVLLLFWYKIKAALFECWALLSLLFGNIASLSITGANVSISQKLLHPCMHLLQYCPHVWQLNLVSYLLCAGSFITSLTWRNVSTKRIVYCTKCSLGLDIRHT